jgi:hypothetical protein
VKRSAFAVLVVFLAAGCGGTTTVTKTVTVVTTKKNELREFGHIKSLTRKGGHFEMRFDPEWFLSGVTANVAAAEDGAVDPGQPVPNDNYRVDEGHRLFTYIVPVNAHATVLAKGVAGTPVSVAELARIVDGTSSAHPKLWEPITTGFWLRIDIDTVRSLDQQYQP